MKKKLAILMDPINSIKPYKDSSFALLLAAMDCGCECWYFTAQDVFVEQGCVFAHACPIEVNDRENDYYTLSDARPLRLSDFNIILMRKDPPFDMQYIYLTYILTLAEKAGVKIVNAPEGLRAANEKFITCWFPAISPPTLVSNREQDFTVFRRQHGAIVLKPLDGMGGRGVFYVLPDDKNFNVILETLTQDYQQFIMAQAFVSDILTRGDKRVLIMHGKTVEHALVRQPSSNDNRGNIAAGAHTHIERVSTQDLKICEAIIPTLKIFGLDFVGIDIIGDYLTEVNVTSPTGIREIEAASHLTIARDFIRTLLSQC